MRKYKEGEKKKKKTSTLGKKGNELDYCVDVDYSKRQR